MSKEVKVFNTKKVVAVRNALAELPFKLSGTSLKIVLLMVSLVDDKRDEEFEWYTTSFTALSEILGIENDTRRFDRVEKALVECRSKSFLIPGSYYSDGVPQITGWFHTARPDRKNDKIELCIGSEMKPFFLKIKESDQFSKFRVYIPLSFSNTYTGRFYLFILAEKTKAGAMKGHWDFNITIHEIRKRLDMLNKKGEPIKYALWGHFRDRVLIPSTDELNDKSDLNVSWTAIKRGRHFHSINFEIEVKAKKAAKPQPMRITKTRSEVDEEAETLAALRKAFTAADEAKKNAVRSLHGEKLKALQDSPAGKVTKAETLDKLAEEQALKEAKDSGIL